MTNATSVKDRLKNQAIEERKTMQDKLVGCNVKNKWYSMIGRVRLR